MDIKKWNLIDVIDEVELLQNNEKFTIVDIETTGFSPEKGAEIIQIAAVKIREGKMVKAINTFVKPVKSIPEKITELTGITNSDVAKAPSIEVLLPRLAKYLEGEVIVCHNAKFDWDTFLNPMMKKQSIELKNQVFCTFNTYFKGVPGLGKGGYTNEALANQFGFQLTDAHRADEDIKATATSLIGLKKMFSFVNLESLKKAKKVDDKRETPVVVKSVNYWKRTFDSDEMERHYVRIEGDDGKGSVFYDLKTNQWRNKDYPGRIKYPFVEKAVFEFLKIQSMEEFKSYRPKSA